MRYRAWVALGWVLRRLPLGAAYGIADAVGGATFLVWTRGRANMLANYAVVLPEASRSDRRRVARRSLQNYCRYVVDFMRLPANADGAGKLVSDDEGVFSRLAAAMGDGRGVIVVCMHFGNWDLGAGATAARGFNAAAIAESFGDERLDRDVFGARERLGLRLLPLGRTMLPAVRHLKKGGLLAILLDRPAPGEGVVVPFFGLPTEVPAGPSRLALRTGSSVGVAAFVRQQRGAPGVQVLAEFGLDCDLPPDDRERALTASVMAAHERYIRRWPEQWYMFRRMWPGGASQ